MNTATKKTIHHAQSTLLENGQKVTSLQQHQKAHSRGGKTVIKKSSLCFVLLITLVLSLTACGERTHVPGIDYAHTHEYREWKVIRKATCTESGIQARYCLCGIKETETIDALGHIEREESGACIYCKKALGKYNLEGRVIVNFGDSIFGNYRAPVDISSFLANHTLATVYNVGFGGCRMSTHSMEAYDAFGMCRLADAIVSGDWHLQEEALAIESQSGGVPSYFADSLAQLKGIDFHCVDVITIAYGTNDFTAGKALEHTDNQTDITVFAGALRYSIDTLHKAYPHLKIVICTPTYRFKTDEAGMFLYDSEEWTINGKKLTDFVQKIKDVADEYGLPCIDNYVGSGICYDNKDLCFSGKDGTHPNEIGRQKIATYMAQELYRLFG